MSRIGRLPIAVPSGVQIKIDGHKISIKGQRGELVREFHPDIEIKLEDGACHVLIALFDQRPVLA